jgi:hypothetical protein
MGYFRHPGRLDADLDSWPRDSADEPAVGSASLAAGTFLESLPGGTLPAGRLGRRSTA